MKYETPEMTTLTPAIKAIQALDSKSTTGNFDSIDVRETTGAYADWE
jgi:hypothetical protein